MTRWSKLAIAFLFTTSAVEAAEPRPPTPASPPATATPTATPKPDAEAEKRVVVHVEATGIGVPAVRARVRAALPEDLVIVDASDFASALKANGQVEPVGATYAVPAKRAAMYDRLKKAAADVRADAVIIVLMFDTPKLRVARLIVVDANEQAPVLDQLLTLEPAKAKSDETLIRAALAPAVEHFRTPEPPPPPPEVPPVAFEPVAEEPPKRPVEARPPRFLGVSVRVFPGAPTVDSAGARLGVPLTKRVTVTAGVTGYYVPRPGDHPGGGVTGAARVVPFAGWIFEAALAYAQVPKIAAFFQLSLTAGGTFGKNNRGDAFARITLTESGTRFLYLAPPGPRGLEANVLVSGLVAELRPYDHIYISPSVGHTAYDRSLTSAKGGLGVLASSGSPYAWDAYFGGYAGYDFGRWLPLVGARHYLYAANTGTGTAVGPGLRFSDGQDFFDIRPSVFFNDTRGRYANGNLENILLLTIDVGATF